MAEANVYLGAWIVLFGICGCLLFSSAFELCSSWANVIHIKRTLSVRQPLAPPSLNYNTYRLHILTFDSLGVHNVSIRDSGHSDLLYGFKRPKFTSPNVFQWDKHLLLILMPFTAAFFSTCHIVMLTTPFVETFTLWPCSIFQGHSYSLHFSFYPYSKSRQFFAMNLGVQKL